MALINKDTRIARYSAEEGVGWVPLVPDLATSARFDKYLEETAYYVNDYSDRGEGNLLRDSLLNPRGPVWDDMNEEFLLDLYEGWDYIPMVGPDTPVFAFTEGKAATSAPLSKAISSPLTASKALGGNSGHIQLDEQHPFAQHTGAVSLTVCVNRVEAANRNGDMVGVYTKPGIMHALTSQPGPIISWS